MNRIYKRVLDFVEPLTSIRPADNQTNAMIQYYEHCDYHYRAVASTRAGLNIHYGFYDHQARSHKKAVVRSNEILADLVKIKAKDVCLDAGCGIGGSAIWLAEKIGARVYGIALVPNHISRAKRYAFEHGVDRLTAFSIQDYTKTDFAPQSFDVVWAIESICHASDKEAFVCEAERILKPGGRIIMADGFQTSHPMRLQDEKLLTNWINCWQVPKLCTMPAMRVLLAAHNFDEITCHDFTDAIFPDARRLYQFSVPFLPIFKFLFQKGYVRSADYHNIIGARLQYKALLANAWQYGVITAQKLGK